MRDLYTSIAYDILSLAGRSSCVQSLVLLNHNNQS